MSFNISGWSIRRPIPTLVLFLVLTIAGLVSFGQLGIDANPNIDIPAVSVTVTQTGAGPQELESQVTQKIEDAVAGLGNIDQINSTVDDGVSTTVVSFILGTDTDRATNDVRNAVAQIRQNLPADINEPIVQRLEFEGGAIMTYAVLSDGQRSVEELSDLVDRQISRALLAVKGVAQIQRVGGVDREIRVNLNPTRLEALGITASQVNDQIRSLNINLPGGRSDAGGQERGIRTLGSAETVAALRDYNITLPGGGTVPLSSLGSVEDDFADPRQSAFFNDQPVVAFSVFRSSGSVLVSVEQGIREAVETLQATLPDDIRLELIFTRATYIEDSYQASIEALILGCILAVIVVWIFLRDWRATLITATALPLSIIPTFLVLKSLDYTLNSMTLLGLTLAVGNLVDDAIVEIENVERHIRMGKRPFKAALDSTAEVGLAVLTTTATIVAVFIPVAFMGGIPGQFFQPFGVTVAVATMFSTLVARMMTPMMAAYLLKPQARSLQLANAGGDSGYEYSSHGNGNGNGYHTGNGNGAYSSGNGHRGRPTQSRRGFYPYRRLLDLGLRHRLTTVILAIAFFVGSLMLVPLIPTSLFDGDDQGLSTMTVEIPPGSTLEDTQRVTTQITNILLTYPDVESVFSTEGSSGDGRGGGGVNNAKIYVNLKPKEERNRNQFEFEQAARSRFAEIPGARISFDSQGASGDGKDLTIILKSEDPDALLQGANQLTREMRQVPGLVEVTSSASLTQPELLIRPNLDRAADQGVSVRAIAQTASLATLGDNEANLAKFDLVDRQIPIRVQLDPRYRDNLDTIRNLQVPGRDGNLVSLAAVADIEFGSGPSQISRFDRARQVSIGANLEGLTLGQAIAAVNQLPTMQNLPPGVTQEPSGDAEIMRDIFSRFGLALATAVMMIYAVLVLLYNNFLYPFTIMAALPLSIGGALLGLMITQKSLGLFALIGVVLLMGLVTKNSILLVDYALMAKQEGKPQFQAVKEAGVTRLRPILMTSISTIAGMVPIALEIGAGGASRSPMAIAVIGGFTTSTLLTLVVVPVIFTYVDNFQGWLTNTVRYWTAPRQSRDRLNRKKTRSANLSIRK